MSRKKKSIMLFEDVLSMMRRKWPKVQVNDELLQKQDVKLVHECFAMQALLMVDVVGERLLNRRNLLSWVARLCTANLDVILDVMEFTDSKLISGEFDTTEQLFAAIRENYPGLTWVVSPLRYRMDDFYSSQKLGRADSLQDIRTCLLFSSRLTLVSYSKAKEDSYQKFEDTMCRIRENATLPSEFMQRWVASLYPDSEQDFLMRFIPRHGNGAVAEKTAEGLPLTELQKFQRCNTRGVQFLLNKSGLMPLPLPTAPTNRCARITDVPKGIRKRRIICCEPCALMFLQQGVARALDFRHTKLRAHVDLLDATKSARLAQLGSITGDLATIDLTSASDSVRWNFVHALFNQKKYLQRLMVLCRSTHRQYPDGHIMENFHFAPMGSALCFPIEVLTFSAIIEQAIYTVNSERVQNGLKPIRSRYRVYGDDLIVEEVFFDEVIKLLEYYGFIPNMEKTFHGDQPFREACGGHYFLGSDVTPMRISRSFKGLNTQDAKSVLGLIDLANRSKGRFVRLRDVLVHRLLEENNYELECTTDPCNTSALHVDTVFPTVDAMTDRQEGEKNWYQYPERKVKTLVMKKDRSLIHATPALRYWKAMASLESGPLDQSVDVLNQRSDCKLARRWRKCV